MQPLASTLLHKTAALLYGKEGFCFTVLKRILFAAGFCFVFCFNSFLQQMIDWLVDWKSFLFVIGNTRDRMGGHEMSHEARHSWLWFAF